jgi:hypothetical protein
MIGPGWMPSRPRPLPRVRRGFVSYTLYARRRRAPKRRSVATRADPAAPRPCGLHTFAALDCGGPVDLPVARLLASGSETRGQLISGHLAYWLRSRWTWLRPRTVPMIVALAGMFAVLGATKYLPDLCR